MSYTKVKAVTVKRANDGTWYAHMNAADSNVRPITYYKYDCLKGRATKAEVEASLMRDYLGGMLQGRGTKYGKYAEALWRGSVRSVWYDRYVRVEKLMNDIDWGRDTDRFNARNRPFVSAGWFNRRGNEAMLARSKRLHIFLNRWGDEALRHMMEVDFPAWKPTAGGKVMLQVFGGCYVTRSTKRQIWYNSVAGETSGAKIFTREAAERLAKRYTNCSMVLVPVSA